MSLVCSKLQKGRTDMAKREGVHAAANGDSTCIGFGLGVITAAGHSNVDGYGCSSWRSRETEDRVLASDGYGGGYAPGRAGGSFASRLHLGPVWGTS